MRERDSVRHQLVDCRCADVWISESADGVETLLVGAVPQDVGAIGHAAFVLFAKKHGGVVTLL